MTRLILAHVADFIHSSILRHRPFFTCVWVVKLWPDAECRCRFCRWAWPVDL